MAIRKQAIYDKSNQKFSGFVDYGGYIQKNSEDQASEALAFLLVGLRSHWRCPIGYFFTNKLNGHTGITSKECIVLGCRLWL